MNHTEDIKNMKKATHNKGTFNKEKLLKKSGTNRRDSQLNKKQNTNQNRNGNNNENKNKIKAIQE